MKNNILKIVYIIIVAIILAILLVSTYNNNNITIDYFCILLKQVFKVKFVHIAWLYAISGVIIGILINQIAKSKMIQMYNAYQKRHESTSIENDNDKARIKTLESKIATLEAALDSALKNQ